MGRGLWLRNLGSSLAISQTLGTLAHSPTLGAVGLRGCLHPFGETSCREGGGTVKDFDLKKNAYPVCPHCGLDQIYQWEYELEEGETTDCGCEHCHKPMTAKREDDGTYTTSKIEEEITVTDRLEFLLKFFHFGDVGEMNYITGILYDDDIIDALNGNSYTLPEPISESDKNDILNALDEAIRKERKKNDN